MEKDELTAKWGFATTWPIVLNQDSFTEMDEQTIELLRRLADSDAPRMFVVADQNVVQNVEGLGARLGKYINDHGIELAAQPEVIAGGEKAKNVLNPNIRTLTERLIDARIGVNDIVLVIGGGSLLDVAGYVAGQIRGGVKLVRVPTTIAAMIESSFSTTARIDCDKIKDGLRIPSCPAAAIVDVQFATSVMDGVWRGNASEIVRHAMVSGSKLLNTFARNIDAFKARDIDTVRTIVREAIASRAEKGESGLCLWCSNRLEAISGYKLPHGYAMALAICIECAYSVEKGYMREADQEKICRMLADCGALDCLARSRHLLREPESILHGLDAWRLATGAQARELPCGYGKTMREDEPDREAYSRVIKEFCEVASNE